MDYKSECDIFYQVTDDSFKVIASNELDNILCCYLQCLLCATKTNPHHQGLLDWFQNVLNCPNGSPVDI